MNNEQVFLLVIVIIVVIMVAIVWASKTRRRLKRVILGRFGTGPEAGQAKPQAPERTQPGSSPHILSVDESKAELERLHKLIEDRKEIARTTDISYHLWGLYQNLVRHNSPNSQDRHVQAGEWYDVKILQASQHNGLNKFAFELKGVKYQLVDDEEQQGWCENMKYFSLFLYNDAGRCLIEIPMKMKVDSTGRTYSISSDGPKAFLPGGWMNDFINVKLKRQRLHNQEIRAQKHRERLSEIEELKERFGFLD